MKKLTLIALAGAAALAPPAECRAQQGRGFAAITIADLAATESWYESHLGTRRLSASRAPSGVGQNVVIGNDYFTFELIHFTAKAPSDTVQKNLRAVGLQKVGIWVATAVFDSVYRHLDARNATFLGGILTDRALNARTFIVRDNSGVLLQYFASMAAGESSAVFNTSGAFFALSVPDLEASRTWYEEKLGLRTTMRPPATNGISVAILEGGGLIVELIHNPRARSRVGAHSTELHGYFKAGIIIDDYDATLTRLRERGVTFAFGPFPARDGQRANFAISDNAGNLIQFFQR